jgi:small-conductance mechanosensitive channel
MGKTIDKGGITMEEIVRNLVQWLILNGIRIGVVIVLTYLLIRILRGVSPRMVSRITEKGKFNEEQRKRVDTLSRIVQQTLTVMALVLAGIIVLGQVGINVGPILAGAGVLGLAVGFGAQSLVKDIITGFFILLDNRMNVGDVVQIAGVAGLVEEINLRVTILRDLEGKVHFIPNGDISVVSNLTKEWARSVLDIGVAYKEDTDHVCEVLKRVGDELLEVPDYKEVILEPMEILGVDNFGDSQVTIKVMFKTKPIKQWMVSREFRRRVKKAFDAEGIEIPFPHRTLYMGTAENPGKLVVQQVGGE